METDYCQHEQHCRDPHYSLWHLLQVVETLKTPFFWPRQLHLLVQQQQQQQQQHLVPSSLLP